MLLFLLTCFIAMPGKMLGQSANAIFRNITSSEGLPNTSVSDITQDSFGYIWIATWQGVFRYDGKDFDRISHQDCRNIEADDKGGVWISFTGGGNLGYYSAYTDSIKYYHVQKSTYSPPVSIDSLGTVWSISDGKIIRLDTKRDSFILDSPPIADYVGYLAARGNGELIFGTRIEQSEDVLIGLRDSKGQYTFQDFPVDLNSPLPGSSFSETYPIFGMVPYKKSGILLVNEYGWAFQDQPGDEWIFNKPLNGEIIKAFRAVFLDKEDNLWLSQEDALSKIDIQSGSVTIYPADPNNPKSILPYPQVATGGRIFQDRQGVIWITRYGSGISRMNSINSDFGLVRDDQGKVVMDVLSSVEMEDGSYYIGSRDEDQGLYYFSPDGKLLKRYGTDSPDAPAGRSVSNKLSHYFVWSLTTTPDGSVWAGTGWPRKGQGGLNRIRPGQSEIVRFKRDSNNMNSLSDDWVWQLLVDGSDRLWIAVRDSGWCWMNPEDEIIHRLTQQKDIELPAPDIVSGGFINLSGNLVFEFHGKFFEVNHQTLKIKSLASEINSENSIYLILQDKNGKYWFINQTGFGFLNEQASAIEYSFDMSSSSFPDVEINTLNIDDEGMVWLATNNGLIRFNPETENYAHFGYKRGLQSNFFRSHTNYKGPSGKIYLAGTGGMNIIDPEKIAINPYPPEMVFTGLKLDNREITPGERSALRQPIQVADLVTVEPNTNIISIDFAAIHFAGDNDNRYMYKLDGFDQDWRDGAYIGNASYTNLSSGHYTLLIKGSNRDGVWSDGSTSINIHILPPWFKTWWAYVIYAILFILLIVLLDRYQRKRVIAREREKARQKELEQAEEIRKAYQELKTTQQQLIHNEKMASLGELTAGIAHEIQNPLNFVNNFSEVSSDLIEELKEELQEGDTEEVAAIANDLLQNLEKISHHGNRASNIVKSMLEHSRVGSGEKQPTDLKLLADEYLRLAYHGLRARDNSFNAEFSLEADQDLPLVMAVPQDIGRVLLNLINNAFYTVSEKAKQEDADYKPTVVVGVHQHDNIVEISVKDNGNGIPDSVKEKIFQPFFTTKPTGQGTGLGLSLSYDIVTNGHGGTLSLETQIGKGSQFIIRLNL